MQNQEQKREDGTLVPGFTSELGTRFSTIIDRIGSQKAVAEIAGVTDEQVGKWESGKARMPLLALAKVAEAANVSLDWLALGKEPPGRVLPQLGQDYVMIPRYDVEASAGAGTLTERENVVDFMAFQAGWVKRVLDADPRRLALISAKGDSMEPTIRAGDLLLVDTGVDRFLDDAIYVVIVDGHLLVKRVQLFMGGAVAVKSDNPSYVEQTLSPEEASGAIVAGRVRWIGRLI